MGMAERMTQSLDSQNLNEIVNEKLKRSQLPEKRQRRERASESTQVVKNKFMTISDLKSAVDASVVK
jgi:hypothetical protein